VEQLETGSVYGKSLDHLLAYISGFV